MEKRAFIAIIVSFLIIYAFQAYFFPKVKPTAPAEKQETPVAERTPAPPPPPEPEVVKEVAPTAPPQAPAPEQEYKIRIETDLYKAIFTNRGARLCSFKLKAFKDHEGKQLELVSEAAVKKDRCPFALEAPDKAKTRLLNETLFAADHDQIQIQPGGQALLVMTATLPSGDWVVKKFQFVGGSYDLHAQVSLSPGFQDASLTLGPGLGNPGSGGEKDRRWNPGTVLALRNGKIERLTPKTAEELGSVDWIGIENQYFLMLARFPTPVQASISAPQEDLNKLRAAHVHRPPQTSFAVYAGPKDYTLLKQLGTGMENIIDYGWFSIVAKPLLTALRFFNGYVHNYGLAIIILTLVIKIILFPLTYSSTVSMLKMQKMQPEVAALRERYSKKKSIEDRQRMNAEIMKIYKERGINPMGGCIPIVLQFPVLIAFYNLLSVSIELRNAPFIFWIADLSAHDPYYITPILMGVTQVILQRMTPPPADPVQAKMMMIMPVFFTLLFLNIQSGLVLYWTVNNVLSIVQQYAMGRMGVVPTRAAVASKKK